MWYIQLKVRAGVNRKFIHKMLKCLSTPGYYASQEQTKSEVFHHRMIIEGFVFRSGQWFADKPIPADIDEDSTPVPVSPTVIDQPQVTYVPAHGGPAKSAKRSRIIDLSGESEVTCEKDAKFIKAARDAGKMRSK